MVTNSYIITQRSGDISRMTHSINCKQWTGEPVFALNAACVVTVRNIIYEFIIFIIKFS